MWDGEHRRFARIRAAVRRVNRAGRGGWWGWLQRFLGQMPMEGNIRYRLCCASASRAGVHSGLAARAARQSASAASCSPSSS